MSDTPAYITPRNALVTGDKIRVADGLYLFFEKFETKASQNVVPLDKKGKDEYLQFIATRDVTMDIEFYGRYQDTPQNLNAFAFMRKGLKLTNTTLTLASGKEIEGDLVLRDIKMVVDNREEKPANYVDVTGSARMTGTITGEGFGSETGLDSGDSGDVILAKQAGPYREQVTLGYQDDRIDHLSRPFLIEGLDENVVTLYEQVQAAIDAAGGDAHTYGPSASPVRVYSGTGMWAGRGVIFGMITYRRWALDCRPNKPDVVIGYIVDGYTADFTGAGSDFCFDNDIGVTASFRQRIKRRSPIQQLSYPAVFSSSPTKVMDNIVGKINSGSVNYAGDSIGAFELRADGGDLRAVDVRGTPYWYGKLTFTRRVGGWISGKAMCQRMVALPLEGNQTLPSYTLETSFRQLYAYERAGFPSLATLIPACDY